MTRLLIFAAVTLAVFSCTYGGSDHSTTSDSTTINTTGNNAAMGTDSTNNLGGTNGATGAPTTIDSGISNGAQPAIGTGTDTQHSSNRSTTTDSTRSRQ